MVNLEHKEKVHVITHPLVQHKLSLLRDKNTGPKDFRQLIEEISMLLVYEATRDLPLKEVDIQTPLAATKVKRISGKKLGLIPVLRAGLGMLNAILKLIPTAKVGHIGLYRDPKTLKPVEYYVKLPEDIHLRDLFLLDPMLATGGSLLYAINYLKDRGAKSINVISIISSEYGVSYLRENAPDVDIYTAAIDKKLNEKGYIIPGLGDAGDRLFGTK